MNIIKDGCVLDANVGDGISLTASDVEHFRRVLNGGPLTIMVGSTALIVTRGFLAVPEPTPPSNVLDRPDLAGVPAVEDLPKCKTCDGHRVILGWLDHAGPGTTCPTCHGTGKAVEP